MTKPFFHLVAIALVAVGLTACGGDSSSDDEFGGENIVENPSKPPIEVSYSERENTVWRGAIVKELTITALEDVEILEVVPNRGNCTATGMEINNLGWGQTPDVRIGQVKTLLYGETWTLTLSCSRLLDVKIVTDRGEWEFNF